MGTESYEHDEFGPGLRWEFRVLTGDYSGQFISRITGRSPGPRNACGRLLSGLLGRVVSPGEEIETDSLRHQRFIVDVAETSNGSVRVEQVAPALDGGSGGAKSPLNAPNAVPTKGPAPPVDAVAPDPGMPTPEQCRPTA